MQTTICSQTSFRKKVMEYICISYVSHTLKVLLLPQYGAQNV
jgi:hypothetical protein